MQCRIEVSAEPEAAARVQLPGRTLELTVASIGRGEWQVRIADPEAASTGVVGLRAQNASDAVWRVARAAVRAVAELAGESVEFPEPGI